MALLMRLLPILPGEADALQRFRRALSDHTRKDWLEPESPMLRDCPQLTVSDHDGPSFVSLGDEGNTKGVSGLATHPTHVFGAERNGAQA